MTKLLLVLGTANVTMCATIAMAGPAAPLVVYAGMAGACLMAVGLLRK